ncbi:MAG: hypothetical protein IRZ14_04650 [Chloroflexi bacterium]|nr:hypothetical protein [Chloroflexota bacterium]
MAVTRPAVVAALYHQGLHALRRHDYRGATAALEPVVHEASDRYPDAAAHLAAARRALANLVEPPTDPLREAPARPRPGARWHWLRWVLAVLALAAALLAVAGLLPPAT